MLYTKWQVTVQCDYKVSQGVSEYRLCPDFVYHIFQEVTHYLIGYDNSHQAKNDSCACPVLEDLVSFVNFVM